MTDQNKINVVKFNEDNSLSRLKEGSDDKKIMRSQERRTKRDIIK